MERLEYILGWKQKIFKNVAISCIICTIVNLFVNNYGFNLGSVVVFGKISIILAMNLVVASTSEKSSLDDLLSFYPFDKKQYLPYYTKKMLPAGIIMLALVLLSALTARFSNPRELVVLALLLVFSMIHVYLSALIAMNGRWIQTIDIFGFYVCEVLLLIVFIPLTLFIMTILL